MAKGKKTKKKNWRLRRQLRKTLGCLFMISALIVTAIPVQPTEASGGTDGWADGTDLWITSSALPVDIKGDHTEIVYYTRDGLFRFAFVSSPENPTNKIAVIGGYDSRYLEGGKLSIPNVVDGFIQYTDALGTDKGFVAASKNGSPLFYKPVIKTKETVVVDNGYEIARDADGNMLMKPDGSGWEMVPNITEETREVTRAADEYVPCWATDYDKWHDASTDEDVQLYYLDPTDGQYKECTGNEVRIRDADVRYISGKAVEVLVQNANQPNEKHVWSGVGGKVGAGNAGLSQDANGNPICTGVFAGSKGANITSLTVGAKLQGIGDYAFYGCTNLSTIDLKNGLQILGNHSFENCTRMSTVNIESNAAVQVLGDHAFAGCRGLTEFAIPHALESIGDFCFKDCIRLENIQLKPQTGSNSLRRIGYKAFENCESLKALDLPDTYNGADKNNNNYFHLSTVKGCSSLERISTSSKSLDLVTDETVDGTSYNFEAFKKDMPETFYVEGPGYLTSVSEDKSNRTPVHVTANTQHIAFSYLEYSPNPGKYEIVDYARDGADNLLDDPGNEVELVFAVNKAQQLTDFEIWGDWKLAANIVLPEQIGPYGVLEINEGSFSDNCYVKKITLPSKLEVINSNAFRGCHRLKHIIFNDTSSIMSIGSGAFDTQVASTVPMHTCGENLEAEPYLSFSGAIADSEGQMTEPYKYAMKSSSNINQGEQPTTYITYYSGWPTNLTVQYNKGTGMAELIDYPTREEIKNGFSADATDPRTENGYKYPYITQSRSDAASGGASGMDAVDKYNEWKNNGGAEPTEEERAVAESAVFNMVIPNGVTAIKSGLFSGIIPSQVKGDLPETPAKKNDDVKSITLMSIETVEPYTFANLESLETFNMNGGSTLGNYALYNSNKLKDVSVGPSVTTLGTRPFRGCDILENVNFDPEGTFRCTNAIIFEKEAGAEGANTGVVQCLETRGATTGTTTVKADEMAGIKKLYREAFMNCDGIGEVDLSKSSIKEVPELCFADYERDPDNADGQPARDNRLGRVVLPYGTTQIKKGAFWNSNVYGVVIPASVSYIEPDAFSYTAGMVGSPDKPWDGSDDPIFANGSSPRITFIARDGSPAAIYAENYAYIESTETDELKARYTVYFFDAFDPQNPVLIAEVQVMHGEDAELPEPPEHEGYVFDYWIPADAWKAVSADNLTISAMYKPVDATTYTVDFIDWNDEIIVSRTVVEGEAAEAPVDPEREGYLFLGWRPSDFSNVTEDMKIYAQYEKRDPAKYVVSFYDWDGNLIRAQQVEEGEDAIEPPNPTREGYTFSGWLPADGWKNVTKDIDLYAQYTAGDDNNPDDPDNPDNPDDPDDPDDDKKPDDNKKPDGDNNKGDNNNNNNTNGGTSGNSVSENATKYKVVVHGGSGSGEYTAGTIVPINAYARADGTVFDKWTSSSDGVGFVNQTAISTTFTMPSNNVEITANFKTDKSSSVSGNSRSTRRNSTTTVDVTKNGISNEGLASANVKGSSDNFVIRVTDDAQATAAVIAALEARYGDLSNIAYLPMDISLFDASGQTKITDVSGISVDITLPLPDGLIQYAGNNKAASVVDGHLEDLGTKFTTIDGVPCVQFTATHFSPYTIYVDKGNLTEGLIDATPKTGDPIHPKWFLAMGLACISIILFCKKDKKQPKVKAA